MDARLPAPRGAWFKMMDRRLRRCGWKSICYNAPTLDVAEQVLVEIKVEFNCAPNDDAAHSAAGIVYEYETFLRPLGIDADDDAGFVVGVRRHVRPQSCETEQGQ